MRYALIVIALLACFILGRGCTPEPIRVPVKVVEYEKQDTTQVLAQVRVVERVVVQKVFVPKVRVDSTGRIRYLLKTDSIYVAMSGDTTGVTIDTLNIPNTKDIRFTDSGDGSGTVAVRNSSPYFQSSNIEGFVVRPKGFSRLAWGPTAGVGLTPSGQIVPFAGVGVTWNIRARR